MGTRTNLTEEQYVQFSFLSEGQKRLILSEVLEILQYTGARIHHPRACRLLERNGCTVRGEQVFIPSQLVRSALRQIPPVTTIHRWDGSGKLRIEIGRTYFGPGPTCPNFIDPVDGRRRKYVAADAGMVAGVCDELAEIDFVMSLGSISDAPDGLEDVYEFAEMIGRGSKPIIAWSHTAEGCRTIHGIAQAVAGGEENLYHRPSYIFYNEPISPLRCDFQAADKLFYCAERGVPQIFAPANTAGATVPATHAAHLVVTLAESLLGVVLSQLVNPGACIIIGGTQSILDMQHGTFAYGAPELSILGAGLAEMAEYMGLPVFTAAGCSDSKLLDQQAALESSLSIHSSILSAGTLVHDLGFLESGMTGSLELLVLADEIISMARHIAGGVLVTEESMAGETIRQAGPGGDYRQLEHTARWRDKRWASRQAGDGRDIGQSAASQRLQDIVQRQQALSSKLSEPVSSSVREILQKAEQGAGQ
jgi:trimethylamine--corrinoid protein Co-methyltransferase